MSPPRGEKPIFGPLSKNNTGMAALRAGLPVIKAERSNTKVNSFLPCDAMHSAAIAVTGCPSVRLSVGR